MQLTNESLEWMFLSLVLVSIVHAFILGSICSWVIRGRGWWEQRRPESDEEPARLDRKKRLVFPASR